MLSAIGVYLTLIEFIETPTFTRQVQELLSYEEAAILRKLVKEL